MLFPVCNEARMERIYRKHMINTTLFFIFLQPLMGGGENCGIECWKGGDKFYVFGTFTFSGMVAVKLLLLFNILNFLSKSILSWNGIIKNP